MTTPPDLEGQVALVTGAGGGIGRAVCAGLAARGASVLAADLDGDAVAATARAVGGRVLAMRVDVTDESAVEAMVSRALVDLGRLDIAVNNAGIAGARQSFVDVSRHTFERSLTVNLTSVFLCMRAELRVMMEAGAGSIVNLSSASAFRPPSGLAHYAASKNGILGLTRSAAIEFAATGIRVNTVLPGSVDTAMMRETMGDDPESIEAISSRWAAGRAGRPEEVAEAIVWLCSPAASFVNGASLVVDGGMLSL